MRDVRKLQVLLNPNLGELYIRIENYFPSLSTQVYYWVQNPYSESAGHHENMTLIEKEELCELQCDRTLRMRFTDLFLDKFCISVTNEFPIVHKNN